MTLANITSLANQLLDDVKVYVGATWTDEDTEQNIIHEIENGIREISNVGGDSIDPTTNADGSRALIFNYVLYARSGSLPDFRNNYREDLMNLALSSRIASLKAKEDNDEDDS